MKKNINFMKNYRKFAVLFSVIALGLVSCNREENLAVDQQLLSASADIDFTNELDFNAGIEVSRDNSSYAARVIANQVEFATCADVSVNNTAPGVFPKIFTIDFGTECVNNGITRSGIITITVSDFVLNNGSMLTIERGDNYYVNGRKVEGTVVYENLSTNPSIPEWSRTIMNGKITNVAGDVFNHQETRMVKQIAGVNTLILADNIYEITSGSHTIAKEGGSSLNVSIIEPLIKKFSCNHVSQGKLDLQGNVLDGVLDYGNNTCDNAATYTHSNGNVYNIVLF